MRRTVFFAFAAAMMALVSAAAFGSAAAQPVAEPKAYKPVAIELPQPVPDASFQAFRKLLLDIARRKDRPALAKHVARNFVVLASGKNITDPSRSGIDNLAQVIELDTPDASGWEVLASYASDPTGDPDPQRKNIICAPGDPKFDTAALDVLVAQTSTPQEVWLFPLRDGVEVHSGRSADSPVIGKLGLHLIWAHPEDSPIAAVHTDVVRIVMPSGQLGFVSADALGQLATELLCYAKEGDDWTIAGVVGGDTPGR